MDNLSGSHEGGSLPSAPALVADRTEFPLSSGQEQLWFLDQLSPGETTYNISLAYRLRGRLDVEALRRSLTLLVGRHEALRASFGARDGKPLQTITTPCVSRTAMCILSQEDPEDSKPSNSRRLQTQGPKPCAPE